MALVLKDSYTETDDPGLFYLNNITAYGGTEENRDQGGEVLIVAHVTEEGVEEFVTIDSTPFISKTQYEIYNTVDGHYLAERLRFHFYLSITPYSPEVRDVNDVITDYADLIYDPAVDKFYKNILAITGVAPSDPTGLTYWEEIIDFTDPEIRKNTTILVGEYHFLHATRSKKCIKNKYFELTKTCGCSENFKDFLPLYKLKTLFTGACSLMSDLKYSHAEANIRLIQNMCPKCC